MNEATILVGSDASDVDGGFSCLRSYLTNLKGSLDRNLPGRQADEEYATFVERLKNLTSQIDSFIASEKQKTAFLVMGQVQSGKTSHLIGTIADAADKNFQIAIVLTGVTGALNAQGVSRVKSDLQTLGSSAVELVDTDVLIKPKAFNAEYDKVRELVALRLDPKRHSGIDSPLPVVVAMKNPSRLRAIKLVLEKLTTEFGADMPILLIDDEADQASQNAKAQKRDAAETYKNLADLRDFGKNVMLSYTATPQAVLLAEKQGRLRPDYCVTVPPKLGYFGLSAALSDDFSEHRILVDDINSPVTSWNKAPNSLKFALVDFYLVALIRKNSPDCFYQDSLLSPNARQDGMASLQFMIHESAKQANHTAMFHIVENQMQHLRSEVDAAIAGGSAKLFTERWSVLREKVDRTGQWLSANLGEHDFVTLKNILTSTEIRIVNSDKNSPTAARKIPVELADWESKKAWILIGGDILGRGLTIPQLVGSYFLRHSKKPNFDTVTQQMRFCGYRNSYSRLTFLYAEQPIYDLFRYMDVVDKTLWRSASKWDRVRLNISEKIPKVLYAVPASSRLEPTRKAVRDPDLFDTKIGASGDVLFSASGVFRPENFEANQSLLSSWLADNKNLYSMESHEGFLRVDIHSTQIATQLVHSWNITDGNKSDLVAIASLFDPELGEVGLSARSVVLLVSPSLLDYSVSEDFDSLADSVKITRSVNATNASLTSWKSALAKGNDGGQIWPTLSTPHIGDGQRGLIRRMDIDATVVLVEPVWGHLGKNQADRVSLGMAFSILKPKDYEVRLMGHK